MPQSIIVTLSTLCILSLLLVLALTVLLVQAYRAHTATIRSLLVEQMVENQSLRNQLRSANPAELAHLNYTTLPSSKVVHQSSDPVDVDEMAEAINYEDIMARKGYETGELGYDLESAGWSPAVFRRGSDGDPIAYDTTG